jgi:cysteine desulfurase
LADAVRKDTRLVALMAVNNETGALQPVAESVAAVRAACQDAGRVPFFHCDAVQALGTVPFNMEKLGVDGAAFSAHKTGGPRGVGALFLRRPLQVLVQGGGQENGTRPGTSNTAGAQAFAKAAERSIAAIDSKHASAQKLERQLMDGLQSIRGATVLPLSRNAGDSSYVPNIICVAFPGLGGETMVRLLDEAGVVISTGAACSGSRKERRVLDSMGTDPELSLCAVRISTGRETSGNDIQAFLEHAELAYKKFKV